MTKAGKMMNPFFKSRVLLLASLLIILSVAQATTLYTVTALTLGWSAPEKPQISTTAAR